MLDAFSILTEGGIVLWSRTFVPISSRIINSLICDKFIESHSGDKSFTKDSYSVKYELANELGLIFVVVYQSLLQLSFIDDLLENVKRMFLKLYGTELKKNKGPLPECKFDYYFDKKLEELEEFGRIRPTPVTKVDALPTPEQKYEENHTNSVELTPTQALERLRLRHSAPRRGGRRGGSRKISPFESPAQSSGDEAIKPGKKPAKKMRKWAVDGAMQDEDDDNKPLDFSEGNTSSINTSSANQMVDHSREWGSTTNGEFVLKDLGEDDDFTASILDATADDKTIESFGFFKSFIGGKQISTESLQPALEKMREHLMKKNVAKGIADHLCESVEKILIDQKTGNFQTIKNKVRQTMQDSLRRILTPGSTIDVLREIRQVRRELRPFAISFVGVNGVGKSTNLSKVAFFLLQNKLKILIAACDTFRSGAVEQLRVHVSNLKELTEREGGRIELFDRGYGKDAATIAKDAVDFATKEDFDVVLIDTAGRRHSDQRLMGSLEKFASLAKPDLILMVAEALVGTDSVAQAQNFNNALGTNRRLDGFVISKCDTVGDMVGTMISMVADVYGSEETGR
ncbi:Signal recognition particle receptor subunit alpha [Neolecta irregularis DAH-3]|uniref:Signal recognition particle receptor subunit alpha homolog n=1 Tax=Neolecta irregularis (strain DAH-3) TaxID=1198029 RepID=A0A1U7LV74_NEOID|nr:Signal recognition particle receptor subunit alpha [Neolecta irregularis DAH-3]|eukprot:OLL26473.1 Signal recognition particle receptor subunit alpha [Neolecta irregularis DAH-3]